MSASIDRSCPNCGSYKNIGKVNSLYQQARQADGNTVEMNQHPDGFRDFTAGAVIDRPKSAITIKLAPPPRPYTAMNNRAQFAGVAGPAVIFSVLLSFALTFVYGPGSMYTTLPILFILSMFGGAYWVNHQRVVAIKRIPDWEYAMERWDAMYYCRDCDMVYVPGETRTVPAAQMREFAYYQPMAETV